MKNNKFIIYGSLPSLNEYTKINRRNRYEANQMKQNAQHLINLYINRYNVYHYKRPIKLKIIWYEKDMRKDYDNVVFAKKFILDSMVKMKVIPNDNRRYVNEIEEKVLVDKKNPRIEVTILENG